VTATVEYDPSSYEIQDDPFTVYRWLRDEAPLYRNDRLDFWALTRFADVLAALGDPATYSSAQGTQLESGGASMALQGEMMLFKDPPDHTTLRKLVSRAFTPRRIAGWEPVVAEVIGGFLDALAGARTFDVVTDLAGPFPVEVICRIVGVPEGDRQQIRHWTDAMLEREVGNPFPTAEGIAGAMAMHAYLAALAAERRAHPRDDMISHLVEAEVEGDDGTVERLDDGAVARFLGLLTAAGAETVTKLVGNGAMAFAEHPDERGRLQADPSLAPAAVEEVLRWKAPSQYQGRFCVADRTFHGRTIPAGSPVLIVTGAANRDARAYPDPDRFDLGRTGQPLGITFGHGIHYCIGAHLARLEGRIAFTELYRRWPDLEVDLASVRYVHMANVAGPASVPAAV
jgi:cytochrome P450